MLLLFLDNVRSERELVRVIPERLDYMWFLGHRLDDTIPNHRICHQTGRLSELSVTEILHSIQNQANNAPPSGPKAYLLSAIGRIVSNFFADFQFLLASSKTTR